MTATYYFDINCTDFTGILISLKQKFQDLLFGTFALYTFHRELFALAPWFKTFYSPVGKPNAFSIGLMLGA